MLWFVTCNKKGIVKITPDLIKYSQVFHTGLIKGLLGGRGGGGYTT